MTDPGLRHAVCPECHTRQELLKNGRIWTHVAGDDGWTCLGSLDYPNRVVSGRYSEGSQFQSCPAATGEARCPQFPDQAHRCTHSRDHMRTNTRPVDRRVHTCTCGYEWSSLSGSVSARLAELDEEQRWAERSSNPAAAGLPEVLAEKRRLQGVSGPTHSRHYGVRPGPECTCVQASDTGHDPDCPRAAFARGATQHSDDYVAPSPNDPQYTIDKLRAAVDMAGRSRDLWKSRAEQAGWKRGGDQ